MSHKQSYTTISALVSLLILLNSCDDNKIEKQPKIAGNRPVNEPEIRPHSSSNQQPDALTKVPSLEGLGNGAQRFSKLQHFVNNASPETLLAYLVAHQSEITGVDFNGISSMSSQIRKNGIKPTLDAAIQIKDVSLRKILFNSIAADVSGLPIPELATILDSIEDLSVRSELLVETFSFKINDSPAQYFKEIEDIQKFISTKDDNSRANQFLADTSSQITETLLDTAWQIAASLNDPRTRNIIAQGLFRSLFHQDSLKSTQWLRSLPDSEAKVSVVEYLIESLQSQGDNEAADAWKDSIPKK